MATIRSSVFSTSPTEIDKSGKIYVYGKYIFLNEMGKGIHVFDNTDPSQPKNAGFINIPGNTDLAIKDNILLADSYMDLVSIDISNPLQSKEINRLQNVFTVDIYQYGFYGDSTQIITSFTVKDTVYHYSCKTTGYPGPVYFDFTSNTLSMANSSSSAPPQTIGQAGSLATFGLLNNYLYSMKQNKIVSFNVQQAGKPQKGKTTPLRVFGETLYPYKNYLFIGGTTGMDIFDVSSPDTIVFKSTYSHLKSCDPVIVYNDLAYVTLRGNAGCNMNNTNQLEVIDIKDVSNPQLKKSYEMLSPYGLGLANNKLVICEGDNGLRLLEATDPMNIKTVNTITGITPYDVIPMGNDNILIMGQGDISQYRISDMNNPVLLSKIGPFHKTN
jgi:hypothetical protein